jgi:hypothetical protein
VKELTSEETKKESMLEGRQQTFEHKLTLKGVILVQVGNSGVVIGSLKKSLQYRIQFSNLKTYQRLLYLQMFLATFYYSVTPFTLSPNICTMGMISNRLRSIRVR